jgi:hypothetical protein
MTAPLDYNKIFVQANQPTASQSRGIPVDNTGMVSVWQLPKYMLSTDGHKAPVLWFDTGHHAEKVHVPGPGEHSGPGSDITQVHSFDINATPEQIMKQFAAMSQNDPVGFQAIQKQLADAGYYGASSHIYGGWNTQTELALRGAMIQYLKVSQSAGVPVSFTQFLNNSTAANAANGNAGIAGSGGSGGSTAKVPHPTLTDPDQLTFYAQKAAQAALGRNLSQPELTQFTCPVSTQGLPAVVREARPIGLFTTRHPRRSPSRTTAAWIRFRTPMTRSTTADTASPVVRARHN